VEVGGKLTDHQTEITLKEPLVALRKLFLAGFTLAVGFSLGGIAANVSKPAFVLASGRTIDPDLTAYAQAAGPGASAAGAKILARDSSANLTVVEGQWPYDQQADGFLVIERFDSKQAFLDFWHSDEYQAAIELRKGKVELDFVLVVEEL